MIACVSASGQCIPPFVIFDAKRLNMEWRNDEVVGTAYGLSANGWVDSELFKGWLSEHFIAHAVGACLLLLLLDGHSSHYHPELISYAREFGIIIFCLPPHTTHESQPLDASVFKSRKQNWQNACHDFIQSNPSLAINLCCVCFQLYQGDEEDTDWIQCACARWLHEDCIDKDDIIQDIYDRELFCPCCAV